MAAGTLVSSGTSGNMPTGSGSERLCRAAIHELNAEWQVILSGTAGHIYTILSITFNDKSNSSGNTSIQINAATLDIGITTNQTVGAYGSFVWNDKFVIEEDDDLEVYNGCSNGDWIVSYIDQNWT